MKLKQISALVLAGAMAMSTVVTADTYYTEDGEIYVEAQSAGNPYVYVGSGEGQQDTDGKVVITNRDSSVASENTVIIVASEADIAVTLKDVNLNNPDVALQAGTGAGGTLTLNFEGTNTITSQYEYGVAVELGVVPSGTGESGTGTIIFEGNGSGSLNTSYTNCDGDDTAWVIQNMDLSADVIYTEGSSNAALVIDNSTVDTRIVQAACDNDVVVTIKDSDVTVSGVNGVGMVAVSYASDASINIINSNVSVDTGVEENAVAAIGAGSLSADKGGYINLEDCAYEDPTHVSEQTTIQYSGTLLTGALTTMGDGKAVAATKIIATGAEDKTLGDMFTVKSAEGFGMGKTLNVAGTEVEIICAEGAVLSFNAPVLEYFATRGFTTLYFTAGSETGSLDLASLFALNLNAPIKAYFENGALKVFAGDTEVA